MELPCPQWTTRRVPREKFPRKPNDKSDSVSVQEEAKKELGQSTAILTEKAGSITHIPRLQAVSSRGRTQKSKQGGVTHDCDRDV